jgi:hypothetical protein
MAASRFVQGSGREISEIKMNSDQKTQKNLCKNAKTIIRLRLGDYPIRCVTLNKFVLCYKQGH